MGRLGDDVREVFHTADPVRDRHWWLRTGLYWLVLLPNVANLPVHQIGVALIAAAALLAAAAAVWWRDRHPWVLVLVSLACAFVVSDTAAPVAMAAIASRTRGVPVWIAAGLLSLSLLDPNIRLLDTSLTITGTEPLPAWVLTASAVVLFVVLPALIGSLRRRDRESDHERREHEQRQRELAGAQASAQERTRIAQEMHDVLGHKLSLITMQAGALEVTADAGPEAVEQRAGHIRETAKQALDELRAILGVLGGSADTLHPQPGLPEALVLVEQAVASGARIDTSNDLSDADAAALPPAVGAAIHRVVQEGLTNAGKHAPGAAVRLRLARVDDAVVVELTNRPSAARGAGGGLGMGLPGLAERVRSAGGVLHSGATDEGGFRVAATLPLAKGDT